MSIGQTLAEARRARGLSVEDLSAKTRLRATVIRAIENDNFSLCGGDFYARAHVRMLASMVGADADALAAEFDATVADLDEAPATAHIGETEATTRTLTRTTQRRAPNWGAAAVAAVLVVVIAVVAVQLLGGSKSKSPGSQAAAGASSPSPTQAPSETPSGERSPSQSPASTLSASPPASAIRCGSENVCTSPGLRTPW